MNNHSLTRRDTLTALSASVAALTLPAQVLAASASPQDRASAVLDQIAWGLLEDGPEGATGLGLDVGKHAALRSRLGGRSGGDQAHKASRLRSALRKISNIDVKPLDPATQTSLAVVKSAFSTALDGFALPYGDVAVGGWRNTPYAVIQNVGAYLDTPRFLDGDHPVHSASDAEAYLARLSQMPRLLDGELGRMRSATSKGLIPPDFLLDKAIGQMQRTISDAGAGTSGMVTSLVGRTSQIRGQWQARAQHIVSRNIVPALERQLAELKRQRTSATSEAGMWSRPQGDEWYSWGLRASTTTRRSPEEIHKIGREQLAELQARMEPILQKLGYTKGTVGARMKALGQDPRYQFPNNDAGRKQIVGLMEDRIAFIRTKLPLAFRTLVPGKLEIRRMPPAEEPGAPNAYGGAGSIDGKIPGKVWVNLGDTGRHSKFSVPDLVFHEGIPGHHLQITTARERSSGDPLENLLYFPAYSEGWAVYASGVAAEMDLYSSTESRIPVVEALIDEALTLIVQAGLHVRGWTRAQAVDSLLAYSAVSRAEAEQQVDYYVAAPGHALAYPVGARALLDARHRAERVLGSRFDMSAFHDVVLARGAMPLSVVAARIASWTHSQLEGTQLRKRK